MRRVVHQALAVDHPLMRVSHVRDTTDPDGMTMCWIWLVPS